MPEGLPHLRWHPLRSEWVAYAAARQERTFLPPAQFCPFCPSSEGSPPTEIPFADFEIAVFENRFPALAGRPADEREIPEGAGRLGGACEVVVYTPEHAGSLATLSQERRELLVRVWANRYEELGARPDVSFVMPFENRGEAVGVTLHHPHGQVYAYPFVPPVLQGESKAFRQGTNLSEILGLDGGSHTVEEDDHVAVVVPPFARFPYEAWVVPRRAHPGPWTFDAPERASLAAALGRTVARYDTLFDRPMPYVMALHAAPRGEEPYFHFHVEFYPFARGPDRLKYLAGTEVGAGTFAVDIEPEDAAAALRGVRMG